MESKRQSLYRNVKAFCVSSDVKPIGSAIEHVILGKLA
jgi:hypothetical protein